MNAREKKCLRVRERLDFWSWNPEFLLETNGFTWFYISCQKRQDKSDKSDKSLNECKKQIWTKTILKANQLRCQDARNPNFADLYIPMCVLGSWFIYVYIVCIDDLIPYTSVCICVYSTSVYPDLYIFHYFPIAILRAILEY